jgi:primosomal protein N' (replication factor Y)
LNKIAAVRIASPLPQLDQEYDFLIGTHISLQIGSLVEVPFGSGKTAKTGVVVALKMESDHKGDLAEVTAVLSPFAQTTSEVLDLCSMVSTRQAAAVGELLAVALPKRFVRTEKIFTEESVSVVPECVLESVILDSLVNSKRVHYTPSLVSNVAGIPSWAIDFAAACWKELLAGNSSLVVLPDYREVRHFELALEHLGISSLALRHSGSDKGSTRYLNHLTAMHAPKINYGTRTACFTPAKKLSLMILWNDGDESHTEQASPYWNSRDVLLQRQELQQNNLVLASHSPSSDVLRLVDIGYFKAVESTGFKPLARITESFTRLDDETFGLVSKSVQEQKSILIQIANLGWASAIACSNCKELRKCPVCSNGIWIDPSGHYRCRNCRSKETLSACSCGGIYTRPVRIGSSAIADQLRRSFPDVSVIESTGENPVISTNAKGVLVVATPGAEPDVQGGYDLVVIADAAQMLGAPRLRALEQAVGNWANAISLSSPKALTIFVGLSGNVAEQMKSLDFKAVVSADYQDRISLGLPPSTRVASISASNAHDLALLKDSLSTTELFGQLRILPSPEPLVLVLDYQYSDGLALASLLKHQAKLLSAKSKHKKPGERVYRINMDDNKVI